MFSFPLLGRSRSWAVPAPGPFPLLGRSHSWAAPSLLGLLTLAVRCSAQAPGLPNAYNLGATGGTAHRVTGSGTTNDNPPDAVGTIHSDRSSSLGYSFGQPATYYSYSVPVSSDCAGIVTSSGAWANPNHPTPPATLVKQVVKVGWGGSPGTTGDYNIQGDLANQPGSGIASTAQSYTLTARKAINQPGQNLAIASFQPTADAFLSTGSGGTAAGNVSYTLSAFPFAISSPNPNGHPEKGDGTNQFVYDAEQPDGYLTLPALVNVPGALAEDTAWMLPHVALSVSPVMSPDALPSTWTNAAGVLYPSTVGKYPDGTAYPDMSYIYKGLPAQNTGFGDYQMTMKVEGSQSQTANFRVFFNRTAINWPSNDGVTPNWFHYWNMTSAAYGSPVYVSGSRSETVYAGGKWVAHVEDDAGSGTFPAFNGAEGIDAFAWTCRHEAQHVENSTAWYPSGYDASQDADGDIIPDAQEPALGKKFHPTLNGGAGYDPTQPVTPNLTDEFHYGSGFNDNEDYTQRMQRQNKPWTNGSADKEDWASPGHQFH